MKKKAVIRRYEHVIAASIADEVIGRNSDK